MSNTNTAKRAELKKAFNSASTSQEMLKAFKDMETCYEENELGLEYWKLAAQIETEMGDPEEILCYGKKALNIFIYNDNNSLPCFGSTHAPGIHGPPLFIGRILYLLGSACFKLKRYDESLSYLKWSDRNLSKLEEEDTYCPNKCVLHSLHATHHRLFKVKVAMGKMEDAAPHKERILEIKEKYMEQGSLELGEAYKDVYETYLANMHFKDAIPFCLKALEIYSKVYGDDSMEVARIRRNAAVMYNSIGDYEKAYEQNQLAIKIFKSGNGYPDLSQVEMESGCMLIGLGRYEEAVDLLTSLVFRADVQGNVQAMVSITLAKAFCALKNFGKVKKYVKLGRNILEKKGANPIMVACGFADVADICKDMNDYETALTVTRKVLALPGLSQQSLLQASARLFELIDLSGKMKQGIPYMEEAVEKLKVKFGLERCEVAYFAVQLALAHSNFGSKESCVKYFIIAKDIFDVVLGPNDLESLKTSQAVSCNYADLGRFRQAIEYQEKVVEGYEEVGPSAHDELEEAVRLLERMKLMAESTGKENNRGRGRNRR